MRFIRSIILLVRYLLKVTFYSNARSGKANHLVLSDFRTLEVQNVPMGRVGFLVVNTKVHHNLVTSEYNERRESCEQSTKFFAEKLDKKVTHLRDVTWEDWEKFSSSCPNQMYTKR